MVTQKNLGYLAIIFFLIPLYAYELQEDKETINKNLMSTMLASQTTLINIFPTDEEITLLRKKWVEYFEKNTDYIERQTCQKIVRFYNASKEHYLAYNKQPLIFIDDTLFQKILPTLCEKIDFSYIPTRNSNSNKYFMYANPHLLNQLIYDKNLNFSQENLKTKILLTMGGWVANFINSFNEVVEKITVPEKLPLFFELPFIIKKRGFFINDTLYKGSNNTYAWQKVYDKYYENFKYCPNAIEPNDQNRIDYIKTVFYPCCYTKINIEDFSHHEKQSLYTFLVSYKIQYPHLKIPKYLFISCIIPQLEKYTLAQRIRPQLVALINTLHSVRTKGSNYPHHKLDSVIDFMCDELLAWFDKEAVR